MEMFLTGISTNRKVREESDPYVDFSGEKALTAYRLYKRK